ncbi:MAG: C25 family cysteine peptidase [Fibrobacterota bacterium]
MRIPLGNVAVQARRVSAAGLGEPDLLSYHLTALLPANADVSRLTVRMDDVEYSESRRVEPVSFVAPSKTTTGIGEDSHYSPDYLSGRNREINSYNRFYPDEVIHGVTCGRLYQYNLVDILVQKEFYNPQSQQMRTLESGILTITYDTVSAKSYSPPVRQLPSYIMNQIHIQSAALNTYTTAYTNESMGYVIITTESFVEISQNLEPFARLMGNNGFDVTIITPADWGGGSGRTAAINIRNWLRDNLDSKNLAYALLIGNPASSGEIPMVKGPHFGDGVPLIDYHYADLTGDLPEPEQSGYDRYAELHVGRIPVYNSDFTDADNLLERIMAYVTEDSASAAQWRNSILMPLHSFGDAQSGWVFGEYVVKNIVKPSQWEQFRIYDNHMGIAGVEAYPNSYAQTLQFWNEGHFGMMTLQAHGLAQLAQGVLNTRTALQLDNTRPAHGFNISCHNAKPADPSNLLFAQIRSTALSGIGSSDVVWYNQNTSGYGTRNGGNDYAYQYIDGMISRGLTTGESINRARALISPGAGGSTGYQNMTSLILYGCPAVGINSYGYSDVPVSIDGDNKPTESQEIDVRLSSTGKLSVVRGADGISGGVLSVYNMRGQVLGTMHIRHDRRSVNIPLRGNQTVLIRGEIEYTSGGKSHFNKKTVIP